jgi:hypothetical protein
MSLFFVLAGMQALGLQGRLHTLHAHDWHFGIQIQSMGTCNGGIGTLDHLDAWGMGIRPRLVPLKILSFFTLSVTSIFSRLHGPLNVGKK